VRKALVCAFSNSWPPFLNRKGYLFSVASELEARGIRLILIQIHEAHSDAWPIGLPNQPKPNSCYQDRVDRAQEFIRNENPPYDLYIDGWDDQFEQQFRAWPDRYYYVDLAADGIRVIQTSEYGKYAEALIDYDCMSLVQDILSS
jgi:hypothetical protein